MSPGSQPARVPVRGRGWHQADWQKPSRTEGQMWQSSSLECKAHSLTARSLAGPRGSPGRGGSRDLSVQQQQALLGAFWGFLHPTKVPSQLSWLEVMLCHKAIGDKSDHTLSPGQGTKARSENQRTEKICHSGSKCQGCSNAVTQFSSTPHSQVYVTAIFKRCLWARTLRGQQGRGLSLSLPGLELCSVRATLGREGWGKDPICCSALRVTTTA